MIRITGRPMATNGWSFWQYTDESGGRKELAASRNEYLVRKGKG